MSSPCVLLDRLTDTNGTDLSAHTSDSGHTWSKHPNHSGSLIINNQRLMKNSSASDALYLSSVANQTDFCMEIDVGQFTALASSGAYLVFNYDSSADSGYFIGGGPSNGQMVIGRMDTGTATVLKNIGSGTYPGNRNLLRVTKVGSLITFQLEDLYFCSAVDSTYTGGHFGLWMKGAASTTTGYYFQNLRLMTPTVKDSFTDTANTTLDSHTGEIGATWTKQTSGGTNTLKVDSSGRVAFGSGAGDALYYASGKFLGGDGFVDLDIMGVSGTSGYIMLLFGCDPAYAGIQLRYSNNIAFQIITHGPDGTDRQIGSNYNFSTGSNNPYRVRLEIKGNLVRAFADQISALGAGTLSGGGPGVLYHADMGIASNFTNRMPTGSIGFWITSGSVWVGDNLVAFDTSALPASSGGGGSGGTRAYGFAG